MKAISLTQPWATLVAIGAKTVETRGPTWSTRFRGPLAIHAAKGYPAWAQALCAQEPFATALADAPPTRLGQLPRGAIVAVADVVDVARTDDMWVRMDWAPDGSAERAFGNYATGRRAIKLGNVRRLREPVHCLGALGLWRVPDQIEAAVRAQLGLSVYRVAS